MTDPCIHVETIARINATLESLDERAERHEHQEERMLAALETVAAQGESIKFLVEMAQDHKKSLGEAFNRIRAIESPVAEPLHIKIWKSSAGMYFFTFFLVASGVTLIANKSLFLEVWKLVKG